MSNAFTAPSNIPDTDSRSVVEGIARVVSVDGAYAWLEPEQTGSCGGCSSAIACGTKSGYGNFLAARRFPLKNDFGLRVGERIIVGVTEGSLLRASFTAYALPLLAMLGAGIVTQNITGQDGPAALAALSGLGLGLLAARWLAKKLAARGELSLHYQRRAPVAACPEG